MDTYERFFNRAKRLAELHLQVRGGESTEAMAYAERYLKRRGLLTFGVEYASLDNVSDGREMAYLNVGETYKLTLIVENDQFELSSWGDWYEIAEQLHCIDTDSIRCAYCGEFVPDESGKDWRDIVCESCGHCLDGSEAPHAIAADDCDDE